MARIETATLEQAARESKREGFIGAIGGLQFLTAQFFTIFATIVGVYLAGYVGFQRTLEYDQYVKAQQRSDVLSAIHGELQQNIARLQKFNERLPADVGTGLSSAEWPHLRLFAWQAAGRSSSAFDMPPHAVTDIQTTYEDIGEMLNDAEAHQAFKGLTTSNVYERTQFKERLSQQLKFAETSILPTLDKAVAEAEQLVRKYSNSDDASR